MYHTSAVTLMFFCLFYVNLPFIFLILKPANISYMFLFLSLIFCMNFKLPFRYPMNFTSTNLIELNAVIEFLTLLYYSYFFNHISHLLCFSTYDLILLVHNSKLFLSYFLSLRVLLYLIWLLDNCLMY